MMQYKFVEYIQYTKTAEQYIAKLKIIQISNLTGKHYQHLALVNTEDEVIQSETGMIIHIII